VVLTYYQKVELTGTAANSSTSGFVSLYSEGNLTVDDCSLVVGNTPPPPPSDTCSGTANYTLTFTNSWTAQTHPVGAPNNPHFSDFIAARCG